VTHGALGELTRVQQLFGLADGQLANAFLGGLANVHICLIHRRGDDESAGVELHREQGHGVVLVDDRRRAFQISLALPTTGIQPPPAGTITNPLCTRFLMAACSTISLGRGEATTRR